MSVGPRLWWGRCFQTRVRPDVVTSVALVRLGAVAQLGERCNRTAEVRGSIPLSSIRSTTIDVPAAVR